MDQKVTFWAILAIFSKTALQNFLGRTNMKTGHVSLNKTVEIMSGTFFSAETSLRGGVY